MYTLLPEGGRSVVGMFVLIFVSVSAVFFVSAVVTVFALAVKDELQTGKKPLELPTWTGRERESLRADLEAAEVERARWENNGWALQAPKGAAKKYGLFPEALKAFIEGQEKK